MRARTYAARTMLGSLAVAAGAYVCAIDSPWQAGPVLAAVFVGGLFFFILGAVFWVLAVVLQRR